MRGSPAGVGLSSHLELHVQRDVIDQVLLVLLKKISRKTLNINYPKIKKEIIQKLKRKRTGINEKKNMREN